MSADNPPIPVTFFPNFGAAAKTEERVSLADLAERIRATTGPDKASLPWLKLARFGTAKTANGSLRHDANLIAVTGIEADYDGAQMDVDAARDLLDQQGVASVLYTSPSHTEDAPRWRVLCPLSEPMPPGRRSPLLGRLNGLFRGAFARESWTLSQAYYFGSVRNNPSHRVELIDGTPIDQHDDLDEVWIGPPAGGSASAGAGSDAGPDAREDAELVGRIVSGAGFHTELVALAARYAARGMSEPSIVETLRGFMLAHPEAARDARWADRYGSIAAIVGSALNKFGGEPVEQRKAVARLVWRMAKARRHGDEIKEAVLAEAAVRGVAEDRALAIAGGILTTWAGGRQHAV